MRNVDIDQFNSVMSYIYRYRCICIFSLSLVSDWIMKNKFIHMIIIDNDGVSFSFFSFSSEKIIRQVILRIWGYLWHKKFIRYSYYMNNNICLSSILVLHFAWSWKMITKLPWFDTWLSDLKYMYFLIVYAVRFEHLNFSYEKLNVNIQDIFSYRRHLRWICVFFLSR